MIHIENIATISYRHAVYQYRHYAGSERGADHGDIPRTVFIAPPK